MAGIRPPKGMRTPAMLLRDYGKVMPFDAVASFMGKRGTKKQCYANAGRIALDGNMTYVEGYVSIYGVPVAHAWVLNKQGMVIDPTLDSHKSILEYYGIPIQADYLRQTVLRTKVWGVLDVMNNRNILTDDPKAIIQR